MRTIRIAEPDPAWPTRFAVLGTRLHVRRAGSFSEQFPVRGSGGVRR